MNRLNSDTSQRAVAYIRRSTDRQEQSLADQLRAIQQYAAQNGFEIVRKYEDDAISGASSDDRAAFQQMMRDAESPNRRFSFVLTYDIKRFGRVDLDEAGHHRYLLRRRGIDIIYVTEGFNGDDSDDLLRPVKQWQARQELKDLSKVTIRGLLTRADGGFWNGGIPPFGYDLSYENASNEFICTLRFMPDGTRQVLDADSNIMRTIQRGDALQVSKKDRSRLALSSPDRVSLVKNIFTWYVSEGLGIKSIADRLNRAQIPPPMGGRRRTSKESKWCQTTIMSILSNPLYSGSLIWNRLSFAKFHRIADGKAQPVKRFPGHGPYLNDRDDWLVTPNTHSAIISQTTFDMAQRRREGMKRFGEANSYRCGRGAHSHFLLTGLIKCEHCGHRWCGVTIHRGRKRKDGSNPKTYYYGCNGYNKGKSVCPRRAIRKEFLEDWVVGKIDEILREYIGTSYGIDKIRNTILKINNETVPQIHAELVHVERRNNGIKKEISNLVDSLTPVNKIHVDARLNELQREMTNLERRQMDLKATEKQQYEISTLIDQTVQLAGEFKRVFAEGTVEEKRLLLRAFVNKIVINPIDGTGVITFVLLPGIKDPRTAFEGCPVTR